MKRSTVIVYSVYINSDLKREEGRKVSKEEGLPGPKPACMLEAAKALGFEATLEMEKCHPRAFWERGRISVVFFDGEGKDKKPLNPDIPNRKALYKAIAAKVKELGNAAVTKAAPGQKLHGVDKSRAKKEAKRAKK